MSRAGFVIFSRATSRTSEEMGRFTPRVCLATMLISLLAGGVLLLLGRWTIRLLFGPAFDGAFLPMAALLPGAVLLGGAKVLANEISGRGSPQSNSWNSGAALVLTIVLCLVLIPRHGVLGAAIASSAVYGISFLLSVVSYRVTRAR